MAYTQWTNLDQVDHYARTRYRHWDQRWLDRREQSIVRELFARYELRGRILDAPVGYGRFQPLLADFGAVHALDINYYAALYQLKHLGLARGSVAGAAEALPFKADSFDVVFSFRLLQHMHEPEERRAIFREFSRVSRRWVVVSFYLMSLVHRLYRRLVQQPSRITMISRHEMLAEARGAGLTLIRNVSVLPGLHAHRVCLFSAGEAA